MIYFALTFTILFVFIAYYGFTVGERKKRKAVKKPFPQKYKQLLIQKVAFYNSLDEKKKQQFEKRIQLFLASTRITGLGLTVDDETKLLIAAAAIIPVINFPDFEYKRLSEVLIFPGAVNVLKHGKGNSYVLGSVNVLRNANIMKLSKSALEQGFKNMMDKKNVGIHEFIHALDEADGEIDGVPATFLPKEFIKPWQLLVEEEIQKIIKGKSDINAYGATNEAEFLAVVSEYFFEKPQLLEKKHPDIYKILSIAFKQKPSFKLQLLDRSSVRRNSRCPCGSGKKYKHCCAIKS